MKAAPVKKKVIINNALNDYNIKIIKIANKNIYRISTNNLFVKV